MGNRIYEENGLLYLTKTGPYPTLVFKDLDDLYCYVAKSKGIKIGDPESDGFVTEPYSKHLIFNGVPDDFSWMKQSAYDHVMTHLDALKKLNKKMKEEESMSYSVYNKPATVINIDEWEHDFETVHNGLVSIITVNKEFKYRDEADDTIKSIQDSEYIFITSDAMAGAYRRVKCTGYNVNYVTDHNGVELKLTYAN